MEARLLELQGQDLFKGVRLRDVKEYVAYKNRTKYGQHVGPNIPEDKV